MITIIRILLCLHLVIICVPGAAQPLFVRVMAATEPEFPENAADPFRNNNAEVVREGLFAHNSPVYEAHSPTTKQYAGMEDGRLYIRAEGSDERNFIADPLPGWKWDVEGAEWSEDGRHLLVKQVNDRNVPKITLHSEDGTTRQKPYSRAGDPLAIFQYYLVDITNGKQVRILHGQDMPYIHAVGFQQDTPWLLRFDRLGKQADLLQGDPETGEVQVVFSESSDTYLVGLEILQGYTSRLKMKQQIMLTPEGFIWQSERSGVNQLYLYDLEGTLVRPLTGAEQNGIVLQPEKLVGEWLYFMASGSLVDPYSSHLFRTSLREEKIEKIANGGFIFGTIWSENSDSLWIMESSFPTTLQIRKVALDGSDSKVTWAADLDFLAEENFAPELIYTPTEDNSTTIRSLLLKPMDFDPSAKYPVIEYIYGGANSNVIPPVMFTPPDWQLQEIANQGFIVVLTDSRGTSERGKEFHDYIYGRMGQVEIADHAYVLEELGKKYAFMDMDRVGILGHSWGGYFALRALIKRPDLYKVGHLNAPAVDLSTMRVPVEIYMGCLPDECPELYALGDNTNKLDQLQAPIQIIHGTADDDVPVEESRRLVEALKKIGYTNYEFIEYPGTDHIVQRKPEWSKQMIAFFKDNLDR